MTIMSQLTWKPVQVICTQKYIFFKLKKKGFFTKTMLQANVCAAVTMLRQDFHPLQVLFLHYSTAHLLVS